jgi:hypothetical protein
MKVVKFLLIIVIFIVIKVTTEEKISNSQNLRNLDLKDQLKQFEKTTNNSLGEATDDVEINLLQKSEKKILKKSRKNKNQKKSNQVDEADGLMKTESALPLKEQTNASDDNGKGNSRYCFYSDTGSRICKSSKKNSSGGASVSTSSNSSSSSSEVSNTSSNSNSSEVSNTNESTEKSNSNLENQGTSSSNLSQSIANKVATGITSKIIDGKRILVGGGKTHYGGNPSSKNKHKKGFSKKNHALKAESLKFGSLDYGDKITSSVGGDNVPESLTYSSTETFKTKTKSSDNSHAGLNK